MKIKKIQRKMLCKKWMVLTYIDIHKIAEKNKRMAYHGMEQTFCNWTTWKWKVHSIEYRERVNTEYRIEMKTKRMYVDCIVSPMYCII